MYKQVKKPNLNVATSIGMCLKYVQDAFGSGWAGPHAWDAWSNRVNKKHTGTPPRDVYVPIWFDGWWQGNRFGHVAIYRNGVVWSSPWTNKPTHDRLPSIKETERIYGMKYVGWSEDIGGTIVIKKGSNMKITRENSIRLNRVAWYHSGNNSPTDKQINRYVGRDLNEVLTEIRASDEFAKQGTAVRNYDPKKTSDLEKKVKNLEGQNETLRSQNNTVKADNDKLKDSLKLAQKQNKEDLKLQARLQKVIDGLEDEVQKLEDSNANLSKGISIREAVGVIITHIIERIKK